MDTGPLARLSDALEAATDVYVEACDAAAEAENAYLRAHSLAWLAADSVAVSARGKHCDNQPDVVEARCAHNLALAREKSSRAKCDELRHRLMACMSWQRVVGSQT